jgi:integrase
MATPKKVDGKWRIQLNSYGERGSGTFDSKKAAEAWHETAEAKAKAKSLGQAPPGSTLADALDKYVAEVSIKKKGEKWETNKVIALKRDFPKLCAVKMADLSATDFKLWRDKRLNQVAEGTVRREWTLLTHCMRLAKDEWRWIAENPLKKLDRPEAGEARTRLPTQAEIAELQVALGYDPLVAPANKTQRVAWAMMFAIESAMRAGEIMKLQWKYVMPDDRLVRLPIMREGKFKGKASTKTGAARDVPMSKKALAILEVMRSVRTAGEPLVFELKSGVLDTLFRRAKDTCKIEDLHFHDFRAYALTRLSKKMDILSLARVSGHADINELMVYYRTTSAEIAQMMD